MADMKEIKFKTLVDMSDFDAGIQKVQAKLKQISATEQRIIGQGTAQGGGLTPQAQRQAEIFREVSAKKMQRLKEDQMKILEREHKLVEQKYDRMKKIGKELEDQNKTQKEKNKLLAEQKKLENDIVDIQSRSSKREETIQKITRSDGSGDGGDGGGISGVIDKTIKKINPQMIAKLFSGVATGLSMYAGYLGIQKTRDRELLAARGQAVSNLNVGFQDVMQGRGFMSFFEQDERRNALTMALQEREKRLQLDPIRALGSGLTKAIGGGLAGGFAGGPWGAAAGALAAGGSELLNKNTFKMMFDKEAYQADVTAEMAKNFQANLAAGRAINYEKFAGAEQFEKRFGNLQNIQRRLQLSDEELLGRGRYETFGESSLRAGVGAAPIRKRAYLGQKGQVRRTAKYDGEFGPGTRKGLNYQVESDEDFEKRQEEYDKRMVDAQRRFGQSTMGQRTREGMGFMRSSLYDRAAFDEYGNLRGGASASFTEERIRANMQSMFQAGAGSEFMKKGRGATMAAEYQRAGFLNAAPELGMLAGFGGGAAKTEQAYLKLLSEAVRVGFNTSEPSEDLRRFVGAATNLFTQTGGAEGAVRTLGEGMVGTSFQDLKAAQNMYQRVNQEAGQATGYRGALKQAYLVSEQGKKDFAGVSENIKQMFTEMDISSLKLDNPFIKQAAAQAGVSAEEMLQRVRNMQRQGENLSGRTDVAREKLTEAFKKFKTKQFEKTGKEGSEADLKKQYFGTEEGLRLMTDYLAEYGLERSGIGSLKADELESLAGFAMGGDMTGLAKEAKRLGLEGKGTVTDKAEASKAEDQVKQLITVNRNLSNLLSSYEKNSQRSYLEVQSINQKLAVFEALEAKGEIDEGTMKELMNILGGYSRDNFVEIKQPNMNAKTDGEN